MTTAPTPPLWPGETMASGGVDAPAPPPRASLRAAFDAMAPEYDDLRAPWYRHSLSVIDGVLAELAPPTAARPPRALDVGCGTGIQSLRLAAQGYRVMGVDLSPRLLDIARAKLAAAGHDAVFVEGDAVSLPVADASVDVVNCCGPALSLVPRWVDALREIARCLRPGGSLLLEVEGKWNLDAFWEVASALGGNVLGYDEPLGVALRHLLPPWREGHHLEYSLKLETGGAVPLPLKLFTSSEVTRALRAHGLGPRKRWGIHAVTNLIPSTVLHRPERPGALRALFRALAALERRLAGRWPVNTLGCSLLVLAVKEGRD
ncbi:MAG TPA: class I SAM-dependent methyltransferase [Vicinamibacteria bacterium]|jgi:ubiquinone/menaquinone biosynthesis C-methylase UbiE